MQIIKVIPFALLIGASSIVLANDYPTRDRVEYVLHCIHGLGRSTMDDLQTCSCRLDSVASAMSFETYDYAVTYNRNKRMGGEKGGIFRDNKTGKKLSKELATIEDIAKGQCRQVVKIMAPVNLTEDKRYDEIIERKGNAEAKEDYGNNR